jgi:hypothetical protein
MNKFYKLALIALAAMPIANARAQDCNCMVPLDESFSVVPFTNGTAPEYRNDDGYTTAISLPFSFNLYGTDQTEVFINNNGNLSFGGGYSSFVASGFPINNFPMVAAYWSDVDTRGANSGLVYYRVTEHEMVVRYNGVGFFAMQDSLLNDFQIIISDGSSSMIPSGQNISFCYGDMQWATSGQGFGGSPANVGANAGNGVNAAQIGFFQTSGNAYDGAYGNNDGVDYLDNTHLYFSTNPLGANQSPIGVSNYCDTIIGNPGDSLAFFFYDPDADQVIEYDLDTEDGDVIEGEEGFEGLTVLDGNILAARLDAGDRDNNPYSYIVHIAAGTPNGLYPFTITATDNGTPALSVSRDYVLQIGAVSTPELKPLSQVTAYIANDELMFKGLDRNKGYKVFLFDATGKVVLAENTRNTISMVELPSGIYLFTIQNGSQLVSGKVSK